jgi:hypothetical protein
MSETATLYILTKLKTPNIGVTYSHIDNYTNILDTFSYKNYKNLSKEYKNYKQKGGSNNKKDIYLPQPSPFNIAKYTEKYKNKKEEIKTFIISFNNIEYKFYTYRDGEIIYYRLFKNDNDDETDKACIFVIVNKKINKCSIQNILYQNDCLPEAQMDDKKGKTLLKIAFKLIETIKDKYNIKYIQLSDQSVKNCNGIEIQLHKMLTLLTGTTWYGKYGFVPIDKTIRKDFEKNKIIMNTTFIKKVPQLKEYIIKAHQKSKSTKNLQDLINNYDIALEKNVLLKDYLRYFMKNYDNNCIIFYYFYEKLYSDLNLTNMINQSFIKEI